MAAAGSNRIPWRDVIILQPDALSAQWRQWYPELSEVAHHDLTHISPDWKCACARVCVCAVLGQTWLLRLSVWHHSKCLCVCIWCVHWSPGNHLVIPYAGVIPDTQCVKSHCWQSVQHSPGCVHVWVCVCVCVCVGLAFPLAAPTLRLLCCTYGTPTMVPRQFCSAPEGRTIWTLGPFKVQMSHIHTSVCASSEVIQCSSHQLHTLWS